MSKRRLIPLIVVADIAVLLVLLPFILDREKLAVDNEVRAEQAGSFAALSDGVVHYALDGPSNGQTVEGFRTDRKQTTRSICL